MLAWEALQACWYRCWKYLAGPPRPASTAKRIVGPQCAEERSNICWSRPRAVAPEIRAAERPGVLSSGMNVSTANHASATDGRRLDDLGPEVAALLDAARDLAATLELRP